MKGQEERGRGLWIAGSVLLVAALAAWQGMQAWKFGTVGVPRVYTVQLASIHGTTTDVDTPFAGGVTVVAKTSPSGERAQEQEPAQKAEPVQEPRVEVEPPAQTERPPTPQGQFRHEQPAAKPVQKQAVASLAALPSEGEIRGWIRSEAEEAVGGVDEEGLPLYRFVVWLEPPAPVRQKIASVAYNFDAPSAKPPAQASTTKESGFRVKFGGASCARTVVVAVTLEDGRTQMADVDGCAILN